MYCKLFEVDFMSPKGGDAPMVTLVFLYYVNERLSQLFKERTKRFYNIHVRVYYFPYHARANKKHSDASVKERPQTLLVPSEEICKRV